MVRSRWCGEGEITAAVAASETTYKIVHIDFRQTRVNYFYLKQKRLERKRVYRTITFIIKITRSELRQKYLTNEVAPRKFGYIMTPTHKNTLVNYRSLAGLSSPLSSMLKRCSKHNEKFAGPSDGSPVRPPASSPAGPPAGGYRRIKHNDRAQLRK